MEYLEAIILIYSCMIIRGICVRIVKIYGHRINGKCFFLGFGYMKTKEDCFEIKIRDAILEKNNTDVIDIIMPDIRLGIEKESVLIISSAKKRVAVPIEEVIQLRI